MWKLVEVESELYRSRRSWQEAQHRARLLERIEQRLKLPFDGTPS